MTFNHDKFRKAIITHRSIENNLTTREAAKQAGISSATISRLEHGRPPDIYNFAAVIGWMKKDANEFFDNE